MQHLPKSKVVSSYGIDVNQANSMLHEFLKTQKTISNDTDFNDLELDESNHQDSDNEEQQTILHQLRSFSDDLHREVNRLPRKPLHLTHNPPSYPINHTDVVNESIPTFMNSNLPVEEADEAAGGGGDDDDGGNHEQMNEKKETDDTLTSIPIVKKEIKVEDYENEDEELLSPKELRKRQKAEKKSFKKNKKSKREKRSASKETKERKKKRQRVENDTDSKAASKISLMIQNAEENDY